MKRLDFLVHPAYIEVHRGEIKIGEIFFLVGSRGYCFKGESDFFIYRDEFDQIKDRIIKEDESLKSYA